MKKMFDQSVIESDAFLDLSIEARLLYIHLNFEGDSDGFIDNVTKTIRICGVKRDALEDLVNAGFLIRFESGLYVITHWWVNNQIRGDRYTPTKHTAEKEMLMRGEDGGYILIEEKEEKRADTGEIPKNQEVMATTLQAEMLRYEDLGLSKEMANEARKWARYKKERGEPITETQLKSYISNLKEYVQENSEKEAIKSIEDSISNGYKGVIWRLKQARGRPEQKKAWYVEESNYDLRDIEAKLIVN